MSETLGVVLKRGAERLTQAGIDAPLSDARALMSIAFGSGATHLSLEHSTELSTDEIARFHELIERRVLREPVSHITGFRYFWKDEFIVTKEVLDPRPDTETLVERAVNLPNVRRVLELGVGSGAILLSLLRDLPHAKGVGVDISEDALKVARQNARNLGMLNRVEFVEGSWFEKATGKFDLIVSNPPYISEDEFSMLDPEVREWEPKIALCPGTDGLGAYQAIADDLEAFLAPSGVALFEIGYQQADAVERIMSKHGFGKISVYKDLNGKDRVVEVRL